MFKYKNNVQIQVEQCLNASRRKCLNKSETMFK